ncbi:chorismate--pyruvate lyase family protein [Pseudoalteromonas fenneropenaei]|uniref:Probable chorismate pyruvate-lyase n=1 Tax=Pseudoalteromonas fenneropenaei TaxID=1737459 RepID=A0ABV7CNN7_9GAMM
MQIFPLSLDATWQQVESPQLCHDTFPASLHDWLTEPCSLTAKLKSHCRHFAVEVLNEQLALAPHALGWADGFSQQSMWCREVLLWCDGKPVVYGQSWIPQTLLTMTKLGNTPLGEVLFQEPRWTRKGIEIATLNGPLKPLLLRLALEVRQKYARRSVFEQGQQQMLVCEVFLTETPCR